MHYVSTSETTISSRKEDEIWLIIQFLAAENLVFTKMFKTSFKHLTYLTK